MLQQPRPLVPFVLPKRSFRLPYVDRVLATAPIAYWRLAETSGSAAADSSGNGYNGSYSGPTLAGASFPNGDPAPTFDGSNDLVNIYSSGFASAFTPLLGSAQVWGRVASSSVWSDSTVRKLLEITVNANNRVMIYRNNTANQLGARYVAGAAGLDRIIPSISTLDFFCIHITWNKSNDEVKVYFNGTQVGATGSAGGTWAGALVSTTTAIGATNTSGANPWSGSLAHVAIWNYELAAGAVADLAQVA